MDDKYWLATRYREYSCKRRRKFTSFRREGERVFAILRKVVWYAGKI